MADYNDKILGDLNSRWDDPFCTSNISISSINLDKYVITAESIIVDNYGIEPLIVLKDPRNSLLLHVWQTALNNLNIAPHYIIMLRHPIEVAASLRRRNDFDVAQSILLWSAYMTSCEQQTRSESRLVIRYSDLIKNPNHVLDRVENRFGILLPRRDWQTRADVEKFVDPWLRHHEVSRDADEISAHDEVREFYEFMDLIAREDESDVVAPDRLSRLLDRMGGYAGTLFKSRERRFADCKSELELQKTELAEARTALFDVRAQNEALRERLGEIEASIDVSTARASELEHLLEQKAIATERTAREAAESNAQLEVARQEIRQLETARQGAIALVTEMESSIVRANNEAQNVADATAAELADLRLKLDASEERRASVETTHFQTIIGLQRALSEFTTRAEGAATDASRLTGLNVALNEKVESLQEELDCARTRLSKALEQSQALARELVSAAASHAPRTGLLRKGFR
ncbi:MAG TPA: hypothetical protein VGH03_21295 [Caulobacteraceae bacterium]